MPRADEDGSAKGDGLWDTRQNAGGWAFLIVAVLWIAFSIASEANRPRE